MFSGVATYTSPSMWRGAWRETHLDLTANMWMSVAPNDTRLILQLWCCYGDYTSHYLTQCQRYILQVSCEILWFYVNYILLGGGGLVASKWHVPLQQSTFLSSEFWVLSSNDYSTVPWLTQFMHGWPKTIGHQVCEGRTHYVPRAYLGTYSLYPARHAGYDFHYLCL